MPVRQLQESQSLLPVAKETSMFHHFESSVDNIPMLQCMRSSSAAKVAPSSISMAEGIEMALEAQATYQWY